MIKYDKIVSQIKSDLLDLKDKNQQKRFLLSELMIANLIQPWRKKKTCSTKTS